MFREPHMAEEIVGKPRVANTLIAGALSFGGDPWVRHYGTEVFQRVQRPGGFKINSLKS